MSLERGTLGALIASTSAVLLSSGAFVYRQYHLQQRKGDSSSSTVLTKDGNVHEGGKETIDTSVLTCIRNRRSVFPGGFLSDPEPLDDSIIQSLFDAAVCGPYHGKCYSGNEHPAKFVVLGKKATVEMQQVTLGYYDQNWMKFWGSREEYDTWRKKTEDEITGRWGPCTHMIGIVMRRQSGPKRFPEWEEVAAVAAAVQNMHLQSTKFPQLACYWSSWHDGARDSDDMKKFLCMGPEDKCMGFFIIAQAKRKLETKYLHKSKHKSRLMEVVWRP